MYLRSVFIGVSIIIGKDLHQIKEIFVTPSMLIP